MNEPIVDAPESPAGPLPEAENASIGAGGTIPALPPDLAAKRAIRAPREDSRRSLAVAEVLSNAPPRYRGVLERAFAGTADKRTAIRANCLTCSDFDVAEIRACRVLRCPLWLYRPYQRGDEAE